MDNHNLKTENLLKKVKFNPSNNWVKDTRQFLKNSIVNENVTKTGNIRKTTWIDKFLSLLFMNRKYKVAIISFFVFLLLIITSIGAWFLLKSDVEETNDEVRVASRAKIYGEIEVYRGGIQSSQSGIFEFFKGDRVKTLDGNVVITFPDGDLLCLGKESEVDLVEIRGGKVAITQNFGTSYSKVIEGNEYQINDERVSAKALGTEFSFDNILNSDTREVIIVSGEVLVETSSDSENIKENYKAVIHSDSDTIEVIGIEDDDLKKIENFRGIISEDFIGNIENGEFQSDIFAQIFKVTDSLGNESFYSWGNGNSSDWNKRPEITVGENITFSVEARDPNDDPIVYSFEVKNNSGKVTSKQDWSNKDKFTWNVTSEEIGGNVSIVMKVKDNDEIFRFINSDDYTNQLQYEVLPQTSSPGSASDIYPCINYVQDSLGTISYFSWGNGNSAENLNRKEIVVGDTITWTISATDPNSKKLYYRYVMYHPAGNTVLKEWSTSNTFTWTISDEFLGADNSISLEIKNEDEYLRFGSADDYSNQIGYEIVEESGIESPYIIKVTDSLGNTSYFSWGNGNSADWGNEVNVNVGDTVTFTMYADENGGDALQYRFRKDVGYSGYEVVQDWSGSSTYTWTVTEPIGKYVGWSFDIKNSDEYLRFNDTDDYSNQMRYRVN